MSELQESQLTLLHAYMDGELTDAQHAALLAEMDRDPAFRAAVEKAGLIQSRIKALYTPSAQAPTQHAGHTSTQQATMRFARPLAWAAVFVMCIGAWIFARSQQDATRLNAVSLHEGFVRNPSPATVCDTPDKFAAYTLEHLGVAIHAQFGGEVALIGWRGAGASYEGQASRTRLLLAYGPNKVPVVVLFQPIDQPEPVLKSHEDLRLHRREFGTIEAWEITPLDRPAVLDTLTAR